jgi:hypothetical protein
VIKWDETKNMGGGVVKATAEVNGVYYDVSYHHGQSHNLKKDTWYVDATIMGQGKIKFGEYADSLEHAKNIAELDMGGAIFDGLLEAM